jgi:hypothetical protein
MNTSWVELHHPDVLILIELDDAFYCEFVVVPNRLQAITEIGPESLDVFTRTDYR